MAEEKKATEVKPLPGTVLDKNLPSARKVPWTYNDMSIYPQVTFTPEETIKITVHGLMYQLISDHEVTVPSIIQEIYMEHRKALRKQPGVIYTDTGPVKVSAGAGALEPEATKQV